MIRAPVVEALAGDDLPAQPSLGLRARAARGTLVNGGFLVVINALGLFRGLIVAGLLGVAEYGVWGLLTAVYGTLGWLAAIGLDDKYIQQDDPDQERAFQIAFTLQSALCAVFMLIALLAIPVFAVIYDQPAMVGPGLAMAASMPAIALQTPLWVFMRRLEFLTQRKLQIWDPAISFVVTIALAIAGLGVWALVLGTLAGSWTAAVVAVRASPYPLRLHAAARAHLREYASFSWPLFLGSAMAVLAAQVPLLVASRELGLVAVGSITLATIVALFAHRVDEIITQSLYPAIVRVKDEASLQWEAFSMSNRLALLWALPIGAGTVLFAEPFVDHVLGQRWRPAIVLIQCFGAAAAANQIGFNWTAFLKVHGRTRPVAVANAVLLAGVLAIAVPLLLRDGLEGYGAGWAIAVVLYVAVRLVYLAGLFPARRIGADVARAALPTVPAAAAVVLVRLMWSGSGPEQALVQVVLYAAIVGAVTAVWERRLLGDAFALLRGRPVGALAVAAR